MGWMHLGANLKLVNECCRRHISAITSIDEKFIHLASIVTPGVEDLLSLARFKGNLLTIKCSLNHQ